MFDYGLTPSIEITLRCSKSTFQILHWSNLSTSFLNLDWSRRLDGQSRRGRFSYDLVVSFLSKVSSRGCHDTPRFRAYRINRLPRRVHGQGHGPFCVIIVR